MKKLYVLYERGLATIEAGAAVLSFMPPDDEYAFASERTGLFFGRREMDAVRESARKRYVDIVSRIGSTACNGRTLRQVLAIPVRGNPWWYHAVSEKQVEKDATFNLLLQIDTILSIAEREGADEIVLYRAPVEIENVIKSAHATRGIACRSGWKTSLFRASLSRIKYCGKSLYSLLLLRRMRVDLELRPDVVFQGFYDWSVRVADTDGRIEDAYFKALPEELARKGLKCAWFLWLDRYSGKEARSDLIFVQKFLSFVDIVSAVCDLRPFLRYLLFSRRTAFRDIFRDNGCDLYPLFSRMLMSGFCDSSLPHSFLMETAFKKAFKVYRPALSFSFLQAYVAARAFNQAASLGSPQTIRCDMQHAGYGREKTFIVFDADRELSGNPDGIPMPLPDNFFVMGELCRDILLENGVPLKKIFLTGSARFDHIRPGIIKDAKRRAQTPARVLIVPTLNVSFDFEMIRAAALSGRTAGVGLRLRSHPFARIEDLPEFGKYAAGIVSSDSSLEEDLANADLVLFTYSSVAEEAFIRGVPVLRWQANGFNGSVFRDIGAVPVVYSVEMLTQALKKLLKDPSSFEMTDDVRELVRRKCFYESDGLAFRRIAEAVTGLLSKRADRT